MPISRDIEKRLAGLEGRFPTAADELRERDLMARLAVRLETWAQRFIHKNPTEQPVEFPATNLAAFLWEPPEARTALVKFREDDAASLNGTILRLGRVIFEKEQRAVLHLRGWRDPRWSRSTA